MPQGKVTTSIRIRAEVLAAAQARARKLGIDFQRLVEIALERDIKERQAVLITEEGSYYARLEGAPAVSSDPDAIAAAEAQKRFGRGDDPAGADVRRGTGGGRHQR